MTTPETFAEADAAIACAAIRLSAVAPVLAAPAGHPDAPFVHPLYKAAHDFAALYRAMLAQVAADAREARR